MSGYRSAEDFHTYVGGIFRAAFADPDLGARLNSTGTVLRIECPDLATALVVDLGGGTVHEPETSATADVTLIMKSAVANAYWQGKINPTLAVVTGKVRVRGAAESLITVQPATTRLVPVYVGMLQTDGRDDLLLP